MLCMVSFVKQKPSKEKRLRRLRDISEHLLWECHVPQLRTNASRKGRSKGKSSGKARDYAIERSEGVVARLIKIPKFDCKKCGHPNPDGHHTCLRCKFALEKPTDIRLATEIARLQSLAKESYGTFAMDQVTSAQPKGQRRASAEASSSAHGSSRGEDQILG